MDLLGRQPSLWERLDVMTAGRSARTEYESRGYNKLQEEPVRPTSPFAGCKWTVVESSDDQPRFLTHHLTTCVWWISRAVTDTKFPRVIQIE